MKTSAMTLLAASLLLSACSSGPGEADIKAALQAQYGALGMKSALKSVEKLGCEKSGEAYLCDVSVEIDSPFGKDTIKQAARMRFVKGKDGWAVSGGA